MKLRKLRNVIDNIAHVKVWQPDDEDEPVFSGIFMDIPWWLMECKLDTDGDGEAIEARIETNNNGHEIPTIFIYLKG